jgi:hypothetical protein
MKLKDLRYAVCAEKSARLYTVAGRSVESCVGAIASATLRLQQQQQINVTALEIVRAWFRG